jgi:hypothetical protein
MGPIGRPKRRWENNIKIYVGETGREGVDWIYLAKDRNQLQVFGNKILNILVP